MGVVLPTATHPWLPFNADWCSVPPSWQVDLLQAIINAASSSSVDIARCIVQEPDFGGVTVPFYYACLRHDFNWRNLHRVEHHLDYTASGVWNGAVRAEADERLKQDLIVLCNANQYGEPEVPDTWDWTLSMNNKNKCKEVAGYFKLGEVPPVGDHLCRHLAESGAAQGRYARPERGLGHAAEVCPRVIPATVCAPHSFTVSPSSAVCSAGWVSGIVAVVSMSDNTGPVRVVAVDSGVLMGAVSVRVACSGAGYETATVSVVLTARPPQQGCTTALGSLDARTTGGFTLTVATDIEDAPEPDPATVRGLAASYDATVGVLFSVGFTYEPEAAVLSVVSVTPSGLAFTRRDVGNAVGLAGTPSLAGVYTVNLVLRQPGRVDTREFTVTATCRTGHTQQPDRSCEAPAPVVCTVSLGRGWVSSGTLVGSGSWEGGCVLPEGRMGRGGVFYAKHFMFSLLFDAVVTIDLTSSDENSYLFLLGGFGAHGDEVDRDNDSGTGRNSKLANLSLDAGAYTVSASTYHSERTGSFEVSLDAALPLTVTGLERSYRAIVGEDFRVDFTYEPATAGLSVVWHTPGLDPALEEDPAGDVTMTDTITSAGAYAVLLAFAQPGRTVYKIFTVTATCPAGDTMTPGGTCVAPGTRPTVAAGCVTPDRPNWGRIVHSGTWTSGCASTQMPASAAKYYRLDVITPGRFADGNLPVKIELTSDPAASMFMLAGSDPATARLMRFGSSAERTIVSGNTYGLPFGSYIIEVATSQPFDAGANNNLSLAVQLPSGSEQHRDVQLIGNTGRGGDGLSLADFIGRHPDITPDPDLITVFLPDTPYLDWGHDGCGGHQYLSPHTNTRPYGRPELLARFESACMRHDFNWQNLHRIERNVDSSVDSWNQTAKNESDSRLGADLYRVCYIAVGLSIVPDPLGHGVDVVTARTACQQIAGRITALVGPINNPEAA